MTTEIVIELDKKSTKNEIIFDIHGIFEKGLDQSCYVKTKINDILDIYVLNECVDLND